MKSDILKQFNQRHKHEFSQGICVCGAMPKKNKMGNVKVKCLSGHIHDSKKEADRCHYWLAMKREKKIRDFTAHYRFDLYVNSKLICYHEVDFFVHPCLPYDSFVEDVKGKDRKTGWSSKTSTWALKKKIFEALYPNIEYRIAED